MSATSNVIPGPSYNPLREAYPGLGDVDPVHPHSARVENMREIPLPPNNSRTEESRSNPHKAMRLDMNGLFEVPAITKIVVFHVIGVVRFLGLYVHGVKILADGIHSLPSEYSLPSGRSPLPPGTEAIPNMPGKNSVGHWRMNPTARGCQPQRCIPDLSRAFF